MPQQKKPAPQSKRPEPLAIEVALTGILVLMVDEREARLAGEPGASKTVSLLHGAGLSVEAIAQVTGKNGPAIAKAIQRDKAQQGRTANG